MVSDYNRGNIRKIIARLGNWKILYLEVEIHLVSGFKVVWVSIIQFFFNFIIFHYMTVKI